MVKTLLSAIAVGSTTLLLAAHLQPAFAQFRTSNSGFFAIIKAQLRAQTNTTTITINGQTMPKATPTIFGVYQAPTPTTKPTAVATATTKPTTAATSTIKPTGTSTTVKPTGITPTVLPTKRVATATPVITQTVITPTKTTTITPVASDDAMTFIMNELNKYRASKGLSAVQTSAETCGFASVRAAEIVSNFSHDGFQSRIDRKSLPYKSWTKVTENIAMTSNYMDVVKMWENSPGHAENMRADTPYVCVRQSGKYFAYEGMKP